MAVAVCLGSMLGCLRSLQPTALLPAVEPDDTGMIGAPMENPSLVEVHTMGQGGTGWALSSNLIVTARHVIVVEQFLSLPSGHVYSQVEMPDGTVVTSDGKTYPWRLVGTSEQWDVAVVEVIDAPPFVGLPVWKGEVTWGMEAEAWGFPEMRGPRRTIGFMAGPSGSLEPGMWDTSIQVRPGSSGGPVVERIDCSVIGIVSRYWTRSERAIILPGKLMRDAISECIAEGTR